MLFGAPIKDVRLMRKSSGGFSEGESAALGVVARRGYRQTGRE